MLNDKRVVCFLASTNLERSRKFYEDILGLTFKDQDEYALIFDLKDIILRINILPNSSPKSHTALGWVVNELEDKVKTLNDKGVFLERYDWMNQDSNGLTTLDNGNKLAYFKDPDGNILSLTQFSGDQ